MPEDFTPVSGMMDSVPLDGFWAGVQIHKQKRSYTALFLGLCENPGLATDSTSANMPICLR